MNAQDRTSGGRIRDDGRGGRGKNWLVAVVVVVIAGVILLIVLAAAGLL